jgi:hypothetical protein
MTLIGPVGIAPTVASCIRKYDGIVGLSALFSGSGVIMSA